MNTRTALLLVLIATLGCANFKTIGRSTRLPGGGVAIHLDAAQRVVVASDQKYCAEPSPDAIKTFAATLGFELKGLSDEKAAKITAGLQEYITGSGIRTQSTTLMRDALYRICEAYYNGKLKEASVLHLLARSQDLTAVVLAIEQLTTRAFPADSLAPGPGDEEQEQQVAGDEEQPDAGEEEQPDAGEEQQPDAGEEERPEAGEEERPDAGEEERPDAGEEERPEAGEGEQLNAATSRVQVADAGGNKQTGAPPTWLQKEAESKSVREIARTVRELVTLVLEKDYLVESCVALLLDDGTGAEIKGACLDLLSRRTASRVVEREGVFKVMYDPDTLSVTLKSEIEKNPVVRQQLAAWLRSEIGIDITVTELIYGGAYAELRKQAAVHFGLQ